MAVRWVRGVPAFRACLGDADRRVLLQNAWRDLFLLTAAQFSSAFDLRPPSSRLPGHGQCADSKLFGSWRRGGVVSGVPGGK